MLLAISIIIGLWMGYLCNYLWGISYSHIIVLTFSILLLAFIFKAKNFWLKVIFYICLFLSIVSLIPLPSTSFGLKAKNQANLPIDVYIFDFQKQNIKKFPVKVGELVSIGLAYGEDIDAISNNNYFVFAVDLEGKLKFQEKINIGNYTKSGQTTLIIK